MADKEKSERIMFDFVTSARMSYANVLKKDAYKKKGEVLTPEEFEKRARYSAQFVVDLVDPKIFKDFGVLDGENTDLGRLQRQIVKLLQANNKTGKKLKIGRLTEEQETAGTHVEVSVPWYSGDKEADRMKANGKDGEYLRGKVYIKSASKMPPQLEAYENGKEILFKTAESLVVAQKYFYSGAYIVPAFSLNWYHSDKDKTDGVSLYLDAVLFVKHGERFGGAQRDVTERFKGYIGSIKDVDPTGGAASEELDDESS